MGSLFDKFYRELERVVLILDIYFMHRGRERERWQAYHKTLNLNSALVRAGADVFTRNLSGKTALNMVQQHGQADEKEVNQLIRNVEHILMMRFQKGLNQTRRYSIT